MPDRGVNAALLQFAAQLRSEAKRRKVLSGRYLISLEPIPRMAEHRDELMTRALEFLADTAGLSSTNDTQLASFDNGAVIHMKKLSPRGRDIFEMTGPADAKWGGQVLHEIAGLVQSAIRTKAAKLSKVRVPAVLLLVDRYIYASVEEWEASVNAAGPHSFHTIARIDADGQCQVLYSQDEHWARAAA